MTATIISTVLLFGSDEATRHLPEGLYKALMGFHSGWRYIILILMVLGIWFGFQTSKGKRPFAGATKKMGMFTMISIDLQLVAGLLLYFNWISTQTILKYFPNAEYDLIPMRTHEMNQPAARPLQGGLKMEKFLNEYPDFAFSNVDDYVSKYLTK